MCTHNIIGETMWPHTKDSNEFKLLKNVVSVTGFLLIIMIMFIFEGPDNLFANN